jgi:selenocysteine-specific elongation factor
MIVGTAGHIDHGKTSLVRALTGVDTDRLKEEKARGISIELGYAYTELGGGEVLGFVDVPGHERLVHTMVAGVGGIDYSLLVVAADDGVMPQTLEHLAILELLGITQGAVALTKIDRVDAVRVAAVIAQIEALLAATPLAGAPIFPLIATQPADPGVTALRARLQSVAANWPNRRDDGLFRLAVDRVFTLPGRGTVATGTVRAGRVQVGDSLALMPAGREVRVRGIHAQNRAAVVGRAGDRCALNLGGIEKSALSRGDWLADVRALEPSTRMDVQLRWLSPVSLKDGSPLHIHLGTAHRVARVFVLADGPKSGNETRAQLVFDTPICAAPGDSFIARDAQAQHTLGGGRVIDPYAPARRRRSPERHAYLEALEGLVRGEGIEALLRQSPQGVALKDLSRLCGRAPENLVLPAAARLIDSGAGHHVFLDSEWSALGTRAAEVLRAFHAEAPEEPGIDRGRLRRMTRPAVADAVWRVLIEELLARQILHRSGHWLHLPEHRITLTERELELARRFTAVLVEGGLDPPWVRELAATFQVPEDEVRSVLQRCVTQGSVYRVVRDLYYHRDNVRTLAARLEFLARQQGTIEAAQYRDAIGVGRKRTIQILEFFDRVGYTRRTRGGRVLRIDSGWYDEVAER